jgi:dephospho-CoA kinase
VHWDLPQDDDVAPAGVYVKRLLVAPDPVRPAMVHVRLTASPFGRRVVRFRDRLRRDPRLRQDYERVKQSAAAAHAGDEDYDDYTRAKSRWLSDAYREVDAATPDEPWPLDP